MQNNIFVFVVCGDDVHIKTLNYSLGHLKYYSKNEILVVTDLARNKLTINHENIVDVKVPGNFNNHQASIYLKVGLYKFLESHNNYCYLDSDVVAVSPRVDEVFNYFVSPITFANDHCSISEFSPNAIACSCLEERKKIVANLKRLESSHKEDARKLKEEHKKEWSLFIKKFGFTDKVLFNKYQEVINICEAFGSQFNQFTNIPAIKFLMSHIVPSKFNFEYAVQKNGKYRWDRKKRHIYDLDNNLIFDDFNKFNYKKYQYIDYYTFIKNETNYIWDAENSIWVFENGDNVYIAKCDHLKIAIKNKFNISIKRNTWKHWNGGVFLFNHKSAHFMDNWFKKTMDSFKDTGWKTRDQGTLIATAWDMGLQNQAVLPKEFNFLADANNTNLMFDYEKGFSGDGLRNFTKPCFIHVYHNFGKKGWDVWDYIESAGPPGASSTIKNANSLEINNNKTVNGLWIGSHLSKVELLTIRSFLYHGHDFHLWVYDEIDTKLPDGTTLRNAEEIIPREKVFSYENKNQFGHGKGSFAGFSDIFRYKLMHDHGGWWVDMDVCCLKPLQFKEDYVFRNHHQLLAVGNIMKCPQGSEMMKHCYEETIQKVNSSNTDWHMPIHILNHNIEKFQLQSFIREISNQDQWNEIYPLLTRKIKPQNNWHAIHWANENWRYHKMSKTVFKEASTIGYLMTRYGICYNHPSLTQRINRELTFRSIYDKFKLLQTSLNF